MQMSITANTPQHVRFASWLIANEGYIVLLGVFCAVI